MPTTLTLDRDDAVYLVRAVVPAISKDDVTPIICGALFTVTPDQVEATSTDRYRVHRVRVRANADAAGEFLIPGSILRWLSRNFSVFGSRRSLVGDQIISFIFDDDPIDASLDGKSYPCPSGKVTVAIAESDSPVTARVTYQGQLTKGVYPPVDRLIDQATTSSGIDNYTPTLKLGFLAQALAMQHDEGDNPTVKATVTENPNKPGPLLLTFQRGEALIQPNLVR